MGGVLVETDLVARAQAGDPEAFAELVEGHRRELELHCYRILGSAQDAEDTVQETFLAAWQHIAGFEARSSVRTWLYRIATNRCLMALRSARRRQPAGVWVTQGSYPEPNTTSDVLWLEPYPDLLLEGIEDAAPGPDARIEAREASRWRSWPPSNCCHRGSGLSSSCGTSSAFAPNRSRGCWTPVRSR